MKTLKKLKNQSRKARIIFWTGQVIGIIFSFAFLVFVGGNILSELNEGIITFREDYRVFIFFFSFVGIAVGLTVTWFKSKTGAFLMIAFIVLGSLIMVKLHIAAPLAYAPLLISGILLLLFGYIKKAD